MSQTYFIPAETIEEGIEIKKSRFIARAAHAASREAVMTFVEQARSDHPDARHVCWAYLVGNPATACNAGMNDDGEPSGTAGKPILNVIQHKGIGDIVVVVIRYFGGIKLGAGGLVRAYSGASEAVLSALKLKELVPRRVIDVEIDYAQEQWLRHWVDLHDCRLESVTYGTPVVVRLALAELCLDEFQLACRANGITIRE